MTKIKAFIDGYDFTKNGTIERELSPNEVRQYYREYRGESMSFRNGIVDALRYDSHRYKIAKRRQAEIMGKI